METPGRRTSTPGGVLIALAAGAVIGGLVAWGIVALVTGSWSFFG